MCFHLTYWPSRPGFFYVRIGVVIFLQKVSRFSVPKCSTSVPSRISFLICLHRIQSFSIYNLRYLTYQVLLNKIVYDRKYFAAAFARVSDGFKNSFQSENFRIYEKHIPKWFFPHTVICYLNKSLNIFDTQLPHL